MKLLQKEKKKKCLLGVPQQLTPRYSPAKTVESDIRLFTLCNCLYISTTLHVSKRGRWGCIYKAMPHQSCCKWPPSIAYGFGCLYRGGLCSFPPASVLKHNRSSSACCCSDFPSRDNAPRPRAALMAADGKLDAIKGIHYSHACNGAIGAV